MTDCGCELDCAEIPLSPSGRAHHARALPIGAKRLAHGYVMVKTAENQGRLGRRWYAEHRLVMQEHLGRELLPGENVHHINGDRADNRIENLELWVKPQTSGQRLVDLIQYVATHHRATVEAAIKEIHG